MYHHQLLEEINDLEYQIKNNKKINQQRKIIKNLKIYKNTLKYLSPYILSLTLTVPFLNIIGLGYPFKKDYQKEYLHQEKTITTKTQTTTKEQYQKFKNENDKLYCYGTWIKKNNCYQREVKIYNLHYLTEEEITNLLKDITQTRENILTTPITTYTETKYDPPKSFQGYNEAKIYSIDKKNFKEKEEPFTRNLLSTFLYIFINTLTIPTIKITKNEELYEKTEPIKKQYQPIDGKILEKKLKIKKENYNRLIDE